MIQLLSTALCAGLQFWVHQLSSSLSPLSGHTEDPDLGSLGEAHLILLSLCKRAPPMAYAIICDLCQSIKTAHFLHSERRGRIATTQPLRRS